MDMQKKLSPRQAEILKFIEEHVAALQTPPTYREIAKHFKLSAVGTVQDHIRALTAKGYLDRDASPLRKARGLKLIAHEGALSIPILGTVPAGSPMEAIESAEGSTPFPASSREDLFALRVRGQSMRDAGILDGDLVIVKKQNTARHGEIVVGMIDGEATVKRLERKAGRIRLLPENSEFKPIDVSPHSFDSLIAGVVIGVQRFYR